MRLTPEKYRYTVRRGLVYACAEGNPLRMTLYLPDDGAPAARPGMVLIHGGAWLLGTRYQQAWYCRQFARSGFVVMTIDYRLMPRHAFPKCLHDCKAAVRWLRLNAVEFRVDPDRIVAFGASAGGHLAAFLATTEPADGLEGTENPGPRSDVQAAISLYGAVDLTRYRDNPRHGPLSKVTRHFLTEFSGREGVAPPSETWEAASPISYARPSTRPILFVHGKEDWVVHFEQAERFYRKLLELGIPTRLIALPRRGHAFDYFFTRQRRTILAEMLSFLNEYALGGEQREPASQETANESNISAEASPSSSGAIESKRKHGRF